jgi:hypothetical protein
MKPKITIIDGSRFLSRHNGAIVYYDSWHQILKVRMEGGYTFELVRARLEDGSYRDQLLSTRSKEGETSVILSSSVI